jgi:hypothetical protein
MAQWLLRLTSSAVVASRNTGVHVNILAASLHGPRLRQPSMPSVCIPKRLIIGARVLAITTRSPNKSCDMSAHFVDSILSASHSERWFEAGAVEALKPVAPLSQLCV